MKTIRNFKIGSFIYDKVTRQEFMIHDLKDLGRVATNWGESYKGIRITIDNFMYYFSDLIPEYIVEPVYFTRFKTKYRFFRLTYDSHSTRPTIVFYACLNEKYKGYFCNDWISDNVQITSYNICNPFKYIYCIRNGKRLRLKFIHEIQNVLNSIR